MHKSSSTHVVTVRMCIEGVGSLAKFIVYPTSLLQDKACKENNKKDCNKRKKIKILALILIKNAKDKKKAVGDQSQA